VGIGSAVFHSGVLAHRALAPADKTVWRSPLSRWGKRRLLQAHLGLGVIIGQSSIGWVSLLALIAIVLHHKHREWISTIIQCIFRSRSI